MGTLHSLRYQQNGKTVLTSHELTANQLSMWLRLSHYTFKVL